jgi:YD repeat-containing protein
LLTVTENGSAITTYGYDLAGNTTFKSLPNGTATLCTFDALGRKLAEATSTGGGTGGLVSTFDYSQPAAGYPSGYDNVGNVLKTVEAYGHAAVNNRTVTNTYDRTYRLDTETIVETGGPTVATTYGYDKTNNRTGKTVAGPNPVTETYHYGTTVDGYNSNQLKEVSRSVGVSPTTFQYDANGNRTERKLNGATQQTYTYDFDNRLTGLTDTIKGDFAYTYDHRTRRVGRDEQGGAGVPPASAGISFAGGQSVQEYPSGSRTPTVELIRGSDYGGGIGGVMYTIISS